MDIDGIPVAGLERLYRQLRARPAAAELPLIAIGAAEQLSSRSRGWTTTTCSACASRCGSGRSVNAVRMLASDLVPRQLRPDTNTDRLTEGGR